MHRSLKDKGWGEQRKVPAYHRTTNKTERAVYREGCVLWCIWEAEKRISSLRPVWDTWGVPGQPGLHSELQGSLSQTKPKLRKFYLGLLNRLLGAGCEAPLCHPSSQDVVYGGLWSPRLPGNMASRLCMRAGSRRSQLACHMSH